MKEAIQLEVTYDQVLSLVRKLPARQKIKLTKDLEKEAINSKLGEILKTFKTNELSLDVINKEAELVREKYYAGKKH
jgi:hypothetical protein